MTDYTIPLPRAYLGLAAAAMTAITFGLTVFMPAMADSGSQAGSQHAVDGVIAVAPNAVAIGERRCAGEIGQQMLTQDSSTSPATRVQ